MWVTLVDVFENTFNFTGWWGLIIFKLQDLITLLLLVGVNWRCCFIFYCKNKPSWHLKFSCFWNVGSCLRLLNFQSFNRIHATKSTRIKLMTVSYIPGHKNEKMLIKFLNNHNVTTIVNLSCRRQTSCASCYFDSSVFFYFCSK